MATEPTVAGVGDPLPDWLNAKYIEKIMRNYHRDASIKVSTIQVNYAVGKGDNFASILYRVRAPYTCQRLKGGKQVGCFVIKAMFDANSMAAERLGEYDVHNKEMDIYETTIPAMVRLQKAIGDHERLFPQVICIDRELDIIVFEDVSVQGYVMLNRLDGLDLVHTKMVLVKMAKMHALGTVYQQREKKLGKYDTGRCEESQNVLHFSPFIPPERHVQPKNPSVPFVL
jgi:Ecdysteroid kinase-like family